MTDERSPSVSALRDKFNKPSPTAGTPQSVGDKSAVVRKATPTGSAGPSPNAAAGVSAKMQASFEDSVQSNASVAVPVLPVNVLGELDSLLKSGSAEEVQASTSPRANQAKQPPPPLPKKPSSDKLDSIKTRQSREDVKDAKKEEAKKEEAKPAAEASNGDAATAPAAKLLATTAALPSPPPATAAPAENRKSELDKFVPAVMSGLPPTEEEQDQIIVWVLSFIVPFFLLPFVYELTRRLVLKPVRLGIKYAPGAAKLLSWIYVKFRPHVLRGIEQARARLPPMEKVNAAMRAGTELWLATMQTTLDRAWPHLLDLANSVKNLKFREAAKQAFAVMQAWGPMLLLIVPLTKSLWNSMSYASVQFLRLSQRVFSAPFGSVLRRLVQGFGESLADNADDYAERLAGVLGPLVGIQVLGFVFISMLIWAGVIGAGTLETFYVAWFFRLTGVLQPEQPLIMPSAAAGGGGAAAAGTLGAKSGFVVNIDEVNLESVVNPGDQQIAGGGGGGGWLW